MTDLLTASHERMPSAKGLEICIGRKRDGSMAKICFGDDTAHGIIVGPTGTGKTNCLELMMAKLMADYTPDDVQLYVVDGKKADLSILGSSPEDPSYFPHIRLLGSNVEDHEDGIAILRHVEAEMDKRALAIGDNRAKNIEGLRRVTGESWPRMLVVWDEVQELLDGPLGDEAVDILNRLARLGRQSGVHLMLGTQSWKGVQAIWSKPDLLAQFRLRVAMEGGDGVMDMETNGRIMSQVPKYGAAINTNGGKRYKDEDNQVVSVPEVTMSELTTFKKWACKAWPQIRGPQILDGRISPILDTDIAYTSLQPVDSELVTSLIGQKPGIDGEVAGFQFESLPGRNLGILGTNHEEMQQIFRSTAMSAALQHAPGEAKFSIICSTSTLSDASRQLAAELTKSGHTVSVYGAAQTNEFLDGAAKQLKDRAENPKHYVIVYGADRIRSNGFQAILNNGPEQGTHVIGAWSNLERLKQTLGGYISNVHEAVNGLAVLNVSPTDLTSITRNHTHRTWGNSPRKGRALFFDATGDTTENGLVVKLYK